MTKLKYFDRSEFTCNDECVYDLMSEDLLKRLDLAREVANVPFFITSSYRDKETNDKAGGKPNSAHLRGAAVDILCGNSSHRFRIIDALLTAGFTRIGIHSKFIHADVDEDLVECVIWTY
mgnify:CR=1 FL=1|tara:strand:- start:6767 stop:7126 length:360 start_codon:yes stop_codon:yes gene_type:complete